MQQIELQTEPKQKMSHFLSLRSLGIAAFTIMAVTASAPAAAPNWATTVTLSAQGHIIGNPRAKTKLVEYSSYTCGHCAHFETADVPTLKTQYIANGTVSLEIRPLVRDPVDVTIALLAQCGGTAKFAGNHKYLMTTQANWTARQKQITKATIAQLKDNYPNKTAEKNALTAFAVGAFTDMKLSEIMQPRGITPSTARACVANPAALTKILDSTTEALTTHGFRGTPSFMINGQPERDVYNLATLKARLNTIR